MHTIKASLLQAEERKEAALRVLSNYSQFVMACMGEGVTPNQLRLHLMKVKSIFLTCHLFSWALKVLHRFLPCRMQLANSTLDSVYSVLSSL
jgi:hypothetical protein